MEKVARVKVKNNIKASIENVLDEIGGLAKYISAGDTVLLKPNFNTADKFPASSDVNFLSVVIEIISEASPERILLGDSSTFSCRTKTVMSMLKVNELKKKFPNLEIINFDEHKWVKKNIPGGKYLKTVSIPEVLEQVDKLVLLPCLKTHRFAQFTGSLKLSVGFMKPTERFRLHSSKLQEKIAELNLIIHPDLILMDGRKCFISEGPSSGELRDPGIILASTDRVAIDLEGVKIIQEYDGNSLQNIVPANLTQIAHAIKIGIK